MAERSGINWTDHSFAPWHGCTKVSVGAKGACEFCYAEHIDDTRFHKVRFGNFPRLRAPDSTWDQVRAWDRKAKKDGVKRSVFCSHLSDVFDNQVDPTWRADLFLLMHETPNLIWLLLTKRPQNILKIGPDPANWPKNAAIGCTAVTNLEAARGLTHLLYAASLLNPAFVFVSLEPLMELVDLTNLWNGTFCFDALRGEWWDKGSTERRRLGARLHQVITGGETDQGKGKARVSHPDWFRLPRDQCADAGVAFLHKQNGEWLPACWLGEELQEAIYTRAPKRRPEATRRCKVDHLVLDVDGSKHDDGDTMAFAGRGAMSMFKVGKKRAGRLLDGVLHDARPVVA